MLSNVKEVLWGVNPKGVWHLFYANGSGRHWDRWVRACDEKLLNTGDATRTISAQDGKGNGDKTASLPFLRAYPVLNDDTMCPLCDAEWHNQFMLRAANG